MTTTENPQKLAIDLLAAHPQNPRVAMREDVVAAIMENLSGGFDPAHALIVRPFNGGHQIISGHHRLEAAKRAGIESVPCWVRELDDEAAYMALVTSNSQGELSPLEIGLHALGVEFDKRGNGASGGGLKGYAASVGRGASTITEYRNAAKVAINSVDRINELSHKTQHLSAIHALPESCWQPAVEAMLSGGWSAKDTGNAVCRVREALAEKPAWLTVAPDIPACLIAPTRAKSLGALYRSISRMAQQLPEIITIYRLKATDEIAERDGREYRRFAPEPEKLQARDEFISWVNDRPAIQLQAVEGRYEEVSQFINDHAEAREEWRPALTDEEQREKDRREAELRRMERRRQLMPVLLHGDVLEQLRTLPEASFDLICIDPPYNMDKADWDSLGSGEEFADWAQQWLKECQRVLKDSGALYVFGINRMLSHIQHRMDRMGLKYRSWITWDTIQGAGGGLWVNRSESILYYSKTDKTYEDPESVKLPRHEENVREYRGKEYAFKNPSNVWRFPCVDDKHPERTDHPTQKPVELIERIVNASCPPMGRVLDCFIGSGTTGVACMKFGRTCVGIDASLEYIELAQSRFDACEL